MESTAGYTGVVHSEVDAGYTSAEGYTAVVRTAAASGYTGTVSAPVTGNSAAGTRGGRGDATPSAYDAAVVEGHATPGSAAPLGASPQTDGGSRPQTSVGDAWASGDGDDLTDDLASFAASVIGLREDLRSTPEPEPNRSLRSAEEALRGGLPLRPTEPFARPLVGPLAEYLDQQVAQAIAESSPTTLGEAYVQGIFLEVTSTLLRGGAGYLDGRLDPLSSSIRSVIRQIDDIRRRMLAGEGFWEAVNSVANPAVTGLTKGWEANEVAGRAIAAQRRGDWDGAVRLAREAGRLAAGGGIAAGQTAGIAIRGLRTGQELARRLSTGPQRSSTDGPPAPPRPPRPPSTGSGPGDPGGSPTRNDEVTGSVGTDTTLGPQARATDLTHPHAVHPEVPVLDADYVRTLQPLYERLLRQRRAEVALDAEDVPIGTRGRNLVASRVFGPQEWLTASEQQLAHPERGYLTQVTLVSIVTDDGEVPARNVTASGQGRRLDSLELRTDATFSDLETKTSNAIETAYPEGGPQVPSFLPSSTLQSEIDRSREIFDYAREHGGRVRVQGTSLDGRPVELLLDPAGFRGTVPLRYREVAQ